MGKFKITIWLFGKLSSFAGVIATISLASVGAVFAVASINLHGATMNLITYIPYILQFFIITVVLIVASLVLSFSFTFLVDTAAIIISYRFGIPYIAGWIKNPKSKNLRVSEGKLYDDVFTLNFKSVEWRYSSAVCYIHACAPASDSSNFLTWRETNDSRPFPIKRRKIYEVNFLKVNNENNTFSIITNTQQQSFPIGKYPFKLTFSSRMAVKYSEPIDRHHEIYAFVIYRGEDKISVKIADNEKEAKKLVYRYA